MACRSLERTRPVVDCLTKRLAQERESDPSVATTGSVEFMALELSCMASVQDFASRFAALGIPLNILVANAGAMYGDRGVTKEGHELTLATNHLGHFLLTRLMLKHMSVTPRNRIVVVGSSIHSLVRNADPRVLHCASSCLIVPHRVMDTI